MFLVSSTCFCFYDPFCNLTEKGRHSGATCFSTRALQNFFERAPLASIRQVAAAISASYEDWGSVFRGPRAGSNGLGEVVAQFWYSC